MELHQRALLWRKFLSLYYDEIAVRDKTNEEILEMVLQLKQDEAFLGAMDEELLRWQDDQQSNMITRR